MTAIGAVIVDKPLNKTFLGYLCPLEGADWNEEAQAISGFTHEEALQFPDPFTTMNAFCSWVNLNSVGHPIFVSDNSAYDWMFTCWYLWKFCGENPFGFSARNLNDIWKGMQRNHRSSFKHLRITKHDHNPVNDAMGNAEALKQMVVLGLEKTGIEV
jgi:hypothetical protein